MRIQEYDRCGRAALIVRGNGATDQHDLRVLQLAPALSSRHALAVALATYHPLAMGRGAA